MKIKGRKSGSRDANGMQIGVVTVGGRCNVVGGHDTLQSIVIGGHGKLQSIGNIQNIVGIVGSERQRLQAV